MWFLLGHGNHATRIFAHRNFFKYLFRYRYDEFVFFKYIRNLLYINNLITEKDISDFISHLCRQPNFSFAFDYKELLFPSLTRLLQGYQAFYFRVLRACNFEMHECKLIVIG